MNGEGDHRGSSFGYYNEAVAAKFAKYLNSRARSVATRRCRRDAGAGEDPRQPDQRLRLLHRHAHQGRRARRRNRSGSTWSRRGGRRRVHRGRAAALELTEEGTRIADAAGGVTDETWANVAKHYDDEQLAALVSLIALINAYNRLNVIIRKRAAAISPASGGDGLTAGWAARSGSPSAAALPGRLTAVVGCRKPPVERNAGEADEPCSRILRSRAPEGGSRRRPKAAWPRPAGAEPGRGVHLRPVGVGVRAARRGGIRAALVSSSAPRSIMSACRSARWSRNQELQVLTQAMYNARELAMARMQAEADHLGADGIVGVQLRIQRYAWGQGVLEFIATGTAVRPGTAAVRGPSRARWPGVHLRPVGAGLLPAAGGRRGAGRVRARHLRLSHRPSVGDAVAAPGRPEPGNGGVHPGLYEARELALARMQAEATRRGRRASSG